MSQALDQDIKQWGTRFLVFAQNPQLPGFEKPELVYIASRPGEIKAGPEDDRIYTVDAPNKSPYNSGYRPPYIRMENDPLPVAPGPDGHFDHLSPNDPAFLSATLYASVRRVLDIWEDYFGQSVIWHFRNRYPKLELIARINKETNAYAGLGFLEFGYVNSPDIASGKHYLCENFDVVSHEVGHQIKNAIIGPSGAHPDFSAHHEAFGDIVSIVSVLHFDSFVNRLLDSSKGNLFSRNELSRLHELNQSREMRIAFNNKTFLDPTAGPHARSLPFTGGAFDILVEIFQRLLIERGLISEDLGSRSSANTIEPKLLHQLQTEFDQAYSGKAQDFKQALLDARDLFGYMMARAWLKKIPDDFAFWKVVNHLIDADQELNQGKYSQIIRDCFEWRKLDATIPLHLRNPHEIIHEE